MPGRSGRVVVLAGPGVIDDGAIEGLRTFAAAGNLGVANTWGAKGVFEWSSPHHLGTCGLQARDFELLGFGSADLIVATGTSDAESPRGRFGLAPVEVIEPRDLAARAGEVVNTVTEWPNQLYARLSAIAMPGYEDPKVPLHPARAARDLGTALPAGGIVTAEPGPAGLWVARTFPTPALAPGEPRRVCVPARRAAGAAAGLAVDAARTGRPAIFVTDAAVDRETQAVLDEATELGVDLVVVVWDEVGAIDGADDHAALLTQALSEPGVSTVAVPVALEDTALLVEAAGEVVAWGGLGDRS